MSESRLWRAESVGRLRAAMADGSHEARAAFGDWYRWRAWHSVQRGVLLRPFRFGTEAELRGALARLERGWLARHARLCDLAGLDAEMRDVLAASVLRRVFDCALERMGLAEPSAADLGVLG
jgi:hypothetical protein